ncbi:MAG TPA: reverse transcriptase domain-containing protein, partial [Gemmatimonadales bacterium]|nr:reverse transcriptase domain-containing protein [Gemmatimonadales bacterium]
HEFKEQRTRASSRFELVHTDVMGPINPSTHTKKYEYIVTFIDDYSRFAVAYPMCLKKDVGPCLETYLMNMRAYFGREMYISRIRCDNAREYIGGEFKEICTQEKIVMDFCPPYTPQHNGVAERFNQTVQMKVRSMLFDSGLPSRFWDLALAAAVHVYNRSPHSGLGDLSPISKLEANLNPRYNQLKRFGCLCYVRRSGPALKKFEERAVLGVLVGYSETGHLVMLPKSRKLIKAKHVNFVENWVYHDIKDQLSFDPSVQDKIRTDFWVNSPTSVGRYDQKTQAQEQQESSESQDQNETTELEPAMPTNTIFAELQALQMSSIQKSEDSADLSVLATIEKEPTSYQEAMRTKEAAQWKEAYDEEIESMVKNSVWDFVPRPKDKTILDSRCVFKKKTETDGRTRWRTRLVVRGYKDRTEYDFSEVYAPVSRLPAVRVALAVVNRYQWHAYHLDIKTAFLHGDLEDEIYMEIPEGIQVSSETRRSTVCKLKKSLYGLKQSPNRWNQKFESLIKGLGFEHEINDPCIYFKRNDKENAFLVLYVDDILLAGSNNTMLLHTISQLKSTLEVQNLGRPRKYLGMELEYSKNGLFIHQTEYCLKILERFGMMDSKPKDTPMVTLQA